MITHVSISHFKSIQQTNLDLQKVNIIVGPNGVGKSNILDALYFLRDCAVDDIDTAIIKRHGIDSIRQWSKTKTFNIVIELKFKSNRGSGSYKIVISSNKGHYRIIEEAGSWFGPDPRRRLQSGPLTSIFSEFRRSEKGEISVTSPLEQTDSAKTFRVETDQLFLTTFGNRAIAASWTAFFPISQELKSFYKYNIYPNTLREPQIVSRDTILAEDGSNLASVLKNINNRRSGEAKEEIVSALKQIMPSASEIQVKSAGGYYVPIIRVTESSGDVHDFNLSQISDGTLRTLGLLAAFYQPLAPSKVGVEEPEQMIHPGALQIVYESIESFTNDISDNRQVFITTHSPTLLDLASPDDIIWAQLKKGVTEYGHIQQRQRKIIQDQLFTPGELLLAEGFFG